MGVRVSRHDQSRVAPYEFRDTAELFARQYGGHGDIVWVAAPVNCWQVRFTLKPGDPRLRHPDNGTHFEAVLLHEFVDPDREPTHPKLDQLPRDKRNRHKPAFVAIELDDLGTSGLQEILERGSLLSGRGEFTSAEQASKAVLDRHRNLRERTRQELRDASRHRTLDGRRKFLDIPQIPVGIDLQGAK